MAFFALFDRDALRAQPSCVQDTPLLLNVTSLLPKSMSSSSASCPIYPGHERRFFQLWNIFVVGTISCRSSNRFAPSSTFNKLTPVRLPPGWLRLATSPSFMGSPPTSKTMGTVVVGVLCSDGRRRRNCQNHVHPGTNEICGHCWQPVILTVRPPIFDRQVLTFRKAGFV